MRHSARATPCALIAVRVGRTGPSSRRRRRSFPSPAEARTCSLDEDLSPMVAGGVIPRVLVLSLPVAALVFDRTGQCVAVNDPMLRG